ncbi:MAG TPA: Crp/Fnr family transcriptional regulator [Fimbriimonadaceae bacterium]|nr:Crp/Fnr family transcriptional regulator [Fimbriimonadaceae bacterium]
MNGKMDLVPQAPERPTNISALRSSTLFNSLTSDDLDELARVSHMAYAERSETIWLHGNQVDFYGLVGTGFVKMVKSLESGNEATTEIVGPGQVFGLLGVLEGTGCPLSARAVCNIWYLKIPKSSFMPIYAERPILKEHILRRTMSRLHNKMDLMAKMSSGRVEERIALILLQLCDSYGNENERGVTLQVPLTRQDIAEMAGTTVESTIRVMSRWQKDGLTKRNKRFLTITNLRTLEDTVRGIEPG